MTDERCAVEALGRCRFAPATWDKKFAHSLAAKAEDAVLSVRQREVLWKLVKKYRRQMPPICLEEVAWREANNDRLGFEDRLDGDPQDATLRLIFADWLEEHGCEPVGAAQRWIVAHGTFPHLVPCGQSYGPNGTRGCNYEWTFGMEVWKVFGTITAENADYHLPYHHRSRRKAEEALGRAIKIRSGVPFENPA